MGRGNPRVSVRFDPAVIEEVEQTIARLQDTSARPPWDFSDFVRKALTEKLAEDAPLPVLAAAEEGTATAAGGTGGGPAAGRGMRP
jgi:hypothetical protein